MSKRLFFTLVFVLILVAATELFLPMVMSNVVNQGMMSLTGSDRVIAKLTKSPAVLMLGGKFDTIQIKAEQAKIDKIIFSEMSIALTNAELNVGKLLSSRLVELQSVDDVDITAVVSQDELARYLNQTVKGVKNAAVAITPDKIKASSTFSIGGFANVAVSLEGKIVSDGQKIKFVTDRFLINNMITGNIGGSILTEIPLVDVNKLPFHVNVRDIVMENGKVTLYLDNRSH
ncbi:MAG: hypothetical protein H6Q68_3119 [Firmicutes bacterium]|nr:hypothetical protein [Bacillota bacterium]